MNSENLDPPQIKDPTKKMGYWNRHLSEVVQMTNKCMKKSYLWPSEKCKLEQHRELLSSKNAGRDVEKKGILLHCYWECKLIQALWKSFFQKLKVVIPFDSVVSILGISPGKLKSCYGAPCIPMLKIAQFTIAKSWK